jgi:hypothetical protein
LSFGRAKHRSVNTNEFDICQIIPACQYRISGVLVRKMNNPLYPSAVFAYTDFTDQRAKVDLRRPIKGLSSATNAKIVKQWLQPLDVF